MKNLLLFLLLIASGTLCANAQRVGLKTNALYWAAGTPNLGLELRLSRCFTLNVEAGANLYDFHKFGLNAAVFSPELRYWHSARPQAGHFVGALIDVKGFNEFRFKDRLHTAFAFGAGLSYGYSYVLSERWSVEGTVGVGLQRKSEKEWLHDAAQPLTAQKSWHPALLKAGINFTYLLK